jgi:hypothetical protein
VSQGFGTGLPPSAVSQGFGTGLPPSAVTHGLGTGLPPSAVKTAECSNNAVANSATQNKKTILIERIILLRENLGPGMTRGDSAANRESLKEKGERT